jgi:hypothetical protein
MGNWSTVHGFTTSNYSSQDLSALLNTPNIAFSNRNNLQWRLYETSCNYDFSVYGWGGSMAPDDNTMLARDSELTTTFTSTHSYTGYLELQVECDSAAGPELDETNPSCYDGCSCGESNKPIRYNNGEIQMVVDDLTSSGFGFTWGHTRIYNNKLAKNFSFDNGFNWMVHQWAYLVDVNGDLSEIQVAISPRKTYNFIVSNGTYLAQHGALQTLTHDANNNVFFFSDRKRPAEC